MPEFKRQSHRPRHEGFEHLATESPEALQVRLVSARARIAVLSGKDPGQGIAVNEARRLASLSVDEREAARREARAEVSALLNELRRRMAFRP